MKPRQIKELESIFIKIIPTINLNKITVIEEEDYVSIFYGINNIDQDKEAIDIVVKEGLKHQGTFYYPYTFRVCTQFSSKKWSISDEHRINIYQDTNVNEHTSLIKDNKESFERVYWLIKIKE
tara:strand:- start:597 stop:965 length:369 start_codon:yes stop_codon:yes gene_type:complete